MKIEFIAHSLIVEKEDTITISLSPYNSFKEFIIKKGDEFFCKNR